MVAYFIIIYIIIRIHVIRITIIISWFSIYITLYLYIYLVNSNVCVLMFEMNKILLKIHAFFFKKK